MRIVVSLLILLLLAGQASANEDMSSILDVSSQEGTQALGWLQALFGGWVGTWNGEANIISVVGGLFNVLALTFAMIASIYVLIAGAVRTAHEGEVMGKSWSTVWLPVRSAIGLGLLMPTSIGGGTVSVVQAFIMYCALVGSNAADFAWSRAVEFISTGTPIHAPAPVGATEFSRQLFRSLVCVESMQYAGLPAEISKNGDGWTFGTRGECGAIALPKPSKEALADRVKVAATGFSDQGFEIKDRVRAALIPVIATHIASMERVARDFVLGPGQGGLVGGAQGLDDKIDPAGEGYQNVLAVSSAYNAELARFQAGVAAAVRSAVAGSDYGDKYAALLKKGGWTSAGVWTFQISRIQDAATEATATTLSAAKANAAPGDCPSSQSFLSSVATKLGSWFSQPCAGARVGEDVAATDKIHAIAMDLSQRGQQAMPTATDVDYVKTLGGGYVDFLPHASAAIAQSLLSVAATESVFTPDNASGTSSVVDLADPFATASAIGSNLRLLSSAITFSYAGLMAAGGAAENSVFPASAAGGAMTGFLDAIKGVVFGSIALLVTAGFFLAYVIPMLPALVWIMGLLGWLVTVLEAFAAAPLAVAQMLLPEGEGILGTRMERALALIAAMVLRPALMVFGLIAMIVIARIGFGIFNMMFWAVAGSMQTMDIFGALAIVGLYTASMVMLCKMCVSIIHRVPGSIMEWFSGGVKAFGESDMAHAVEGAGASGQASAKAMIDSGAAAVKRGAQRNEGSSSHRQDDETPGFGPKK